MSKGFKYVLIGLGVLFFGFMLWFFGSIVTYIIIASVLTIVGVPVVEFLGRFHIGKLRIPIPIRALLTLILIWIVFIGFFRIFIPIVAREANELSTINVDTLITKIQGPIKDIEAIYNKFKPGNGNISFQEIIRTRIESILDISFLSTFFGSIAGILGNLFIALFSISFITYFLLKDPYIFSEAIVLLVHEKHEPAIRRALKSIGHLLTRYIVGIMGQILEIFLIVTIGMNIVGLTFKQSLLIGLTAAILTIVPYLGPLIGSALGVLMGMAFHANMAVENLLPMVGYMIVVFILAHLVDNFLYQPFAFSASVHAHPLEIFIVIMMAGSLAGVTGMILAIPAYTILRVFAKEFFNNLRVVQKLTDKIDDR